MDFPKKRFPISGVAQTVDFLAKKKRPCSKQKWVWFFGQNLRGNFVGFPNFLGQKFTPTKSSGVDAVNVFLFNSWLLYVSLQIVKKKIQCYPWFRPSEGAQKLGGDVSPLPKLVETLEPKNGGVFVREIHLTYSEFGCHFFQGNVDSETLEVQKPWQQGDGFRPSPFGNEDIPMGPTQPPGCKKPENHRLQGVS